MAREDGVTEKTKDATKNSATCSSVALMQLSMEESTERVSFRAQANHRVVLVEVRRDATFRGFLEALVGSGKVLCGLHNLDTVVGTWEKKSFNNPHQRLQLDVALLNQGGAPNDIIRLTTGVHLDAAIAIGPMVKGLALRPFHVEWKAYCASDDGLYAFFKTLKAPYGFLEHCVHSFESRLMRAVENVFLIPRGSYNRRVALKGAADVDLDLVRPRHVITKEQMDERLPKDGNMMITDVKALGDFCRQIYEQITTVYKQDQDAENLDVTLDETDVDIDITADTSKLYVVGSDGKLIPVQGELILSAEGRTREEETMQVNGTIPRYQPIEIRSRCEPSSFTRSMSFTLVVHKYSVEVDLFPKFIGCAGGIYGVSGKIVGRGDLRQWTDPVQLSRKPPGSDQEDKDDELAAVLFLKQWKRTELNDDEKEILKGYHIALSFERVREELNAQAAANAQATANAQAAANAQATANAQAAANPQADANPLADPDCIFSKSRVIQLMCGMIRYLQEAYKEENASVDRYMFPKIDNPFWSDTAPGKEEIVRDIHAKLAQLLMLI
jgi:hypothetical protein